MNPNIPSSLHLKVITPRRLLVDTDVEEVTLPSLEGYLGILPGHRPLFTALGKGELAYRLGKSEEKFFIQGGYAEVRQERVLVFTELSQDEEEPSPRR